MEKNIIDSNTLNCEGPVQRRVYNPALLMIRNLENIKYI